MASQQQKKKTPGRSGKKAPARKATTRKAAARKAPARKAPAKPAGPYVDRGNAGYAAFVHSLAKDLTSPSAVFQKHPTLPKALVAFRTAPRRTARSPRPVRAR